MSGPLLVYSAPVETISPSTTSVGYDNTYWTGIGRDRAKTDSQFQSHSCYCIDEKAAVKKSVANSLINEGNSVSLRLHADNL